MTVAALSSKKDYLENGTTLTFAVPFRFLTGAIALNRVMPDGTVVELQTGTDFTVAGGTSDDGGSLTLVSSVAGARLRIRRQTARAQQAQYTISDRFPAASHEGALDRQMMIAQEQDDQIEGFGARALLVPDGETALTLPSKVVRTGKFFVGLPDGGVGVAGGTGADQGLREDLGSGDPDRGTAIVAFRQPLPGAVVQSVYRKFQESVSVKDFGAIGDGIADDTVPVQRALLAGIGAVYVPEGKYRITANLVRSGNTLLHGDGLSVSVLVMEGASSLIFNGGAGGADYETHALQIERIGFEVPSVTTKTVISAVWTAGIGGTGKTFTMRDFQISAANPGASFGKAVYLENARNVLIDNGRILGDRDGAPISAQAGIDIYGTDEGAPVEIYIRGVLGYYCQTMITIEGWVEGVNIDQCAAVNCHSGLKAIATTDAPRPWIRVNGCHFNTDVNGIEINNFVQWIVQGNLLYATDFDAISTGYAAMYVNGREASMDSLIVDNILQCLLGSVAKNGIVVQAGGAADDNVTISRNILVSFDTGIVLQAGTKRVRISDDNDIRFCGAKIADLGDNLVCLAEGTGANGSKASLDGHVEKWGSSVVLLNSGGDGVIPFSKPFGTLLTPFVTNGDPTISPTTHFIVNTVASSAAAIAFSVRPNPGAIAVRVNWRAVGSV